MSPAADGVVRRLDAARQKWWIFTLLSTTVLAVCISFGTLLLFMLSDVYMKFPWLMLLGLFLVWLGLTGGLIVLVGRRLGRNQRTLEATARRVQDECPELGSDLINLLQLSTDTKNENRAFCEAAVNEAAARVGFRTFDSAADKESRLRRFLYCMQTPRDLLEAGALLVLLIVVAVICGMLIPSWSSAADRLLKAPWGFVPSVGKVKISVSPGDTTVVGGSNVDVTAVIENGDDSEYKAVLFVTRDGEKETAHPMTPDKDYKQFALTIPSITATTKYRLEIGDSQTPIFTVGVREKAAVTNVAVTYRYPKYLGEKNNPKTVPTGSGALDAPQYTLADVQVELSVPATRGSVLMDGTRYPGRMSSDGTTMSVEGLLLLKPTSYSIQASADAGSTGAGDMALRVCPVQVLPDKAPSPVELTKPPKQSTAIPGAAIPVALRAGDDHGLGGMRLELKVQQTPATKAEGEQPADDSEAAPKLAEKPLEARPEVLKEWRDFDGNARSATRDYTLELKPERFKPGQTVAVRAVAWDKRQVSLVDQKLNLKPQEVAGHWHVIRIISDESQASAALKQVEGIRSALWSLLEKQVRARARAGSILRSDVLAERTGLSATVRGEQVEIQKTAQGIAQSIDKNAPLEQADVKKTLGSLAMKEMLSAVETCDDLVKLAAKEAFDQPVPKLTATQDAIIAQLRRLLDTTKPAEAEAIAEMKKRMGGDLPDDTKKKFEEARKKLDEFLKAQKKVIETSENLAKTPVEDFKEEDEQKLRGLAATEDEWSKFMKELQTDLSKLPEQDFANASMLKELVEIQTELKMAEDALLKKSADIAVPLEQLGYEMAEEMKTNLEKWLPDTPDREKWSQEESMTDKDKEAPMAELPGELEDLIGDLMEQEEDLMDEMEDVSSSAADSLDKGAGWDVADGPISNMSAKGATGNRLPNTSEIGGRAGEGRSGKSSGEFVGDEAIGKGGRKTPSRLTPDPYVKGQISDHSKDEAGGATGGGKESGQGTKGQEGPSPGSNMQKDLQRLAGKQAALRNKAEGIELDQFQISNFHRQNLDKLIEMISQIELDLQAGRYQSVLRERKVVLEKINKTKQIMEGEVRVQQDATANLPADIQQEILGSMHDPQPAGWEDLNRQYFERLTGAASGATGGAAKPEEKPAGK